VRGINDATEDEPATKALVVTDCSLSGLRINKENQVTTLHPIEALMQAYGLSLDGGGSP